MMRRWAIRLTVWAGVFCTASTLFWWCGALRLPGGDTEMYLGPYGASFQTGLWMYHVREPGAVWLLQISIGATGCRVQLPGGLAPAFEWLSVLSGGVFAVAACEFARTVRPRRRDRAAVFAAAFMGIYSFTFFRHIELYAPLMAALMVMYLLAARHLCRGMAQGWVWAGFALAATVHRVALFTLPAFWVLKEPGSRTRSWQADPAMVKGFTAAILALAIPHIVIELGYVMTLGGNPIRHWPVPMETTNWLPELLTPLTQAQADYVRANSQMGSFHLFTFGTVEHWRHFLFFVLASAPVGAPVALALWRRVDTRLEKFLATAAVCGWAWALVWHPHQSYGDWDLFSNPGLATNLLAALLVTKGPGHQRAGGESSRARTTGEGLVTKEPGHRRGSDAPC